MSWSKSTNERQSFAKITNRMIIQFKSTTTRSKQFLHGLEAKTSFDELTTPEQADYLLSNPTPNILAHVPMNESLTEFWRDSHGRAFDPAATATLTSHEVTAFTMAMQSMKSRLGKLSQSSSSTKNNFSVTEKQLDSMLQRLSLTFWSINAPNAGNLSPAVETESALATLCNDDHVVQSIEDSPHDAKPANLATPGFDQDGFRRPELPKKHRLSQTGFRTPPEADSDDESDIQHDAPPKRRRVHPPTVACKPKTTGKARSERGMTVSNIIPGPRTRRNRGGVPPRDWRPSQVRALKDLERH
ncbi:hypothetical protein BT63DRAFT_457816 [Microthyrium microscopicum]|uniref:Uncharacterized protein n=1 Tax=Microthyrium microscopicum TaxID=703497 RepID=A0A6A6U701_9PEZI|nr:hypothetical protein BT63DRAFT_457816 [Microthyrium microscopicum]